MVEGHELLQKLLHSCIVSRTLPPVHMYLPPVYMYLLTYGRLFRQL